MDDSSHDRRKNPSVSLAGSLLVAHPILRDPNFRRTIILMSAHDSDGAMGVVLNRPIGKKLGDIQGEFALGPLASAPLFAGGPVQTERMILAAWEPQVDGFRLHFGIDPERASQLIADGNAQIRAFLGYSGWTSGQLEAELSHSGWIVADPPADLLEQPASTGMWRTLMARETDQWLMAKDGAQWRLIVDEPDELGFN